MKAPIVPALKLVYFPFAGRGETIRLACAYGRLPLHDVRISREQFATLKATGKLAYGQIPVLEITEGPEKTKTVIAQSGALMRYIGKKTGLYPTDNDVEAAVVDSQIDHVNDLMAALHMTKFPGRYGMALTSAEALQMRQRISRELLPQQFTHFEKVLTHSKSGWLANTKTPTIADFFFGSRLRHNFMVERDEGVDGNLLQPFPHVRQHYEQFTTIPVVKQYYENPTSFECLKIVDVSHLPASPLPDVADIHHTLNLHPKK